MVSRRLLAALVLLAACQGGSLEGNDGPDGDPDANTDPDRPDANTDPDRPDADVNNPQPDADVDNPQPDAAPPDCTGNGPKVPFGSHAVPYASGVIKPSNRNQQQLDAETADFYWQWKGAYFKTGC